MPNDPEFCPPPDPMDRLWRHPSELGPLPPAPGTPRRRGFRTTAALGALGGAAACIVGLTVMALQVEPTGRASLVGGVNTSLPRTDGTVTIDTATGSRFTGVAFGDGIVVTSALALAGSPSLRVNGIPATLMAIDPAIDLAAVRTDLVLPPAELSTRRSPEIGERVVVASTRTTREGSITAVDTAATEEKTTTPILGLARTDIAARNGIPGAAVLDTQRRVIGIVSGLTSNGYATVIPIGSARATLDQLRRTGTIRAGWIGLATTDDGRGVRVTAVAAGSPADRAGLRVDDLVTTLDGQPVGSSGALLRRIHEASPGSRIELQRVSTSEPATVRITVAAA
ncbi:MAG: S1C family serine protease [Acidimicrobiia bacterium]